MKKIITFIYIILFASIPAFSSLAASLPAASPTVPPAFDIDLHVDDSEGVQIEGAQHGFRVIVVNPEDEHWTQRVLDEVVRTRSA